MDNSNTINTPDPGNKKYLYFTLFMVALLILLVAAGYFFVNRGKGLPIYEFRKTGKATSTIKVADEFRNFNTSQQNIFNKVELIDSNLANLDPEDTKTRELLVRKAILLSLPRDVQFEKNSFNVTRSIFEQILFSPDSKKDYAKDVAVVAFAKMYDQWCFGSTGLAYYIDIASQLSNFHNDYKKIYTNTQLNTMLSMSGFLNMYQNDSTLKQDRMYLVITSKIDAILLRSFYKSLEEKELSLILDNLQNNLSRVASSSEITFKPKDENLSEAQLQYTISLDIYETINAKIKNKKLNNKKIDDEYVKLYKGFENYKGNDQMTKAMFTGVATVYYVDSLKRRYGNTKDKFIYEQVIPNYFSTLDAVPQAKPLMAAYFRDGIYGGSTWEVMKRNFISLGKDNQKLRDYFTSIGIKNSDVVERESDWADFR